MHSISTTHPLLLLKELEQTCSSHLSEPTPKVSGNSLWNGLGFRIDEHNICIQSNDIDEVLDSHFSQNLSQVPGAKNWLCGLISLRGQALPVIDLKQYIFNKKSILSKKSRLVVIKFSNTRTGLIVEETYGLKRFVMDAERNTKFLPPELSNFSTNVFLKNNQPWIEFSIAKLEHDPNFLNAARF